MRASKPRRNKTQWEEQDPGGHEGHSDPTHHKLSCPRVICNVANPSNFMSFPNNMCRIQKSENQCICAPGSDQECKLLPQELLTPLMRQGL